MFDWVNDVLAWLLDALLWLPLQIFKLVMDGLAAAINAIPVPAALAGLGGAIADITSVAGYFFDVIQMGTGLAIVFTAYLIRFLIRRIPLIG